MNDKTRIAVLQRVGAVIGSDRPIPQTWGEFTVTEQLSIANADPEIAAVLQGQGYMSADLEQQVLSGKLATAYSGQTLEQQREQARQEYLAAAEQRMAEEIEQMHSRQQDAAGQQAARQLSEQLAQQQLTAQARRAGRGW